LGLAQATVSEQLKRLEASLNLDLFARVGGRLKLTEGGARVLRYADEIAALGHELTSTALTAGVVRAPRLVIGLTDVIPKLVAAQLLRPALVADERLRLVCTEDTHDRLIARLAIHEVDVVISDVPLGPSALIRAYAHPLGGCGVSFLATPRRARPLARHFPKSLHDAPFLLPAEGTAMRGELTRWFHRHGVRPVVRGEFSDSALIKAFGRVGEGVFAAPSAIEAQVERQYGVECIGRTDEIREAFFAITVDRRVRHPAVVALCREGQQWLTSMEEP
jgi:LysR family transcriptional activator of nhaA